jgi:hypothetical protein
VVIVDSYLAVEEVTVHDRVATVPGALIGRAAGYRQQR